MIQFFSSPIGLGHITRDVAIAEHMDAPVNFVTGGAAARIPKDHTVHDIYCPPSFTTRNGALANTTRWLWSYYKYYKDCKRKCQEMLKDSDGIISDEDFASLGVAQESGIRTVLITDILSTRFTGGIASIIEKRMNKSMKNMIEGCDTVIMPEHGQDAGNIRRVGPIVRQTRHTREQLRKKFQMDRTTILVSIGGTDAGEFLIQRAIDAAKGMDLDVIIAAGPSPNRYDARNLGFVGNLHEWIYAADLLVSLAGRSTIDEANAYGTPAIFIPIKGHFEQEDNAKRQGHTFDDVYNLRDLIPAKLEQHRSPAGTDGAIKAARIIKDALKA